VGALQLLRCQVERAVGDAVDERGGEIIEAAGRLGPVANDPGEVRRERGGLLAGSVPDHPGSSGAGVRSWMLMSNAGCGAHRFSPSR
jgi:hypothetical protein